MVDAPHTLCALLSFLRSLSDAGEVAVLVVNGTTLVQDAMDRHALAPTATAALGRTLLGAALLGAFRKDEEKIQVSCCKHIVAA
jgi:molecular chaperone Hsp33